MVDDAARLALHRSARERSGDAEGDTLMPFLGVVVQPLGQRPR